MNSHKQLALAALIPVVLMSQTAASAAYQNFGPGGSTITSANKFLDPPQRTSPQAYFGPGGSTITAANKFLGGDVKVQPKQPTAVSAKVPPSFNTVSYNNAMTLLQKSAAMNANPAAIKAAMKSLEQLKPRVAPPSAMPIYTGPATGLNYGPGGSTITAANKFLAPPQPRPRY